MSVAVLVVGVSLCGVGKRWSNDMILLVVVVIVALVTEWFLLVSKRLLMVTERLLLLILLAAKVTVLLPVFVVRLSVLRWLVTALVWLPARLIRVTACSFISVVVVISSGSILMLHVELLLLLVKETEGRLVVALQVVLHVALSSLLVTIRGACHRNVLNHSSQVVYLLL